MGKQEVDKEFLQALDHGQRTAFDRWVRGDGKVILVVGRSTISIGPFIALGNRSVDSNSNRSSKQMVYITESDYSSSASAPEGQSASSLSSCDADLEGGYSSNDECNVNQHSAEIVPKFVSQGWGKPPRRLSQCEQLSFRQRSDLSSRRSSMMSSLPASPATQPMMGFKKWSSAVLTSSNEDLPKTIQFHPNEASCNPVSSSSKRPLLLAIVLPFLALTSTVFIQHSQLSALQSESEIINSHRVYLETSHSSLREQITSRDASLANYKHTHAKMTRVNHDLSETIASLRKENGELNDEVDRLKGELKGGKGYEEKWNKFVGGFGELSGESVVQKYGQGPYQIELEVLLPQETSPSTIKIDLAPVDVMPHSISTFMDQVSMGVWDDSEFGLHAGHVIMAHTNAQASQESTSGNVHRVVPKMVYPEYSPDFPHDKYTIAFPPSSSTDFYINLQSNQSHHSPRIEVNSDGEEVQVEGESCFGKITDVESRRVVDKIDALSVGEGGMLDSRVKIVSAKIVSGAR